MRYMAEGSSELIQEFGERMAGPALSRGIARLYSQHTRVRAGTSGLSSWTDDELFARLGEGEKLLIAGMADADSPDYRRYLRRAGEIFEWAATSMPAESPVPVVLLAASAYQLAGYPARSTGILSEHRLPETTSQVLAALLRADFSQAQQFLLDTWGLAANKDTADNRLSINLLDHLLRALGILTAWLRWGDDPRIDLALTAIKKVSCALRYDSDQFSWLLAKLFATIGQGYKDNALWEVLSPLKAQVNETGRLSLDRYARVAFLEKKILAWPSQRAGIDGIAAEGSFALCTPTGSGKTRVAELVILRHLFRETGDQAESGKPLVLYLAPTRALSAEVESNLSRTLRNIRATTVIVTSLYGGNDFGPADLTNTGEEPTVLISTHEKVDALLRFLGPAIFAQVSCVIVDEAHTAELTDAYETLANAQSRSLRLESLISRLRTLCSPDTTFVALSAVAAEIRDVLAAWITGDDTRRAIAPDYRSTRQLFGRLLCSKNGANLIHYDVLDGQRLAVGDQESAPYVPDPFPPHPPAPTAFRRNDSLEKRMRAHLLWAAMHFAQSTGGKRHSVLISVTEHPEWYAQTFLELLTGDWADIGYPQFFTQPKDISSREKLARCLASCADYFGSSSREYLLLERGIGLHHGKMPQVMARLLIELIQSHVINIVIATSTLSEGVNLPFETVLIPSLRRGRSPVNTKDIVNVAGRAGRPGVSTEGKTLVLLSPRSREWAQRIKIQTYRSIINSMTTETTGENAGPRSPLRALITGIGRLWSRVSGSKDIGEFIGWLETTPFSIREGQERALLTSLDTLDQQLLAGIEEAENLNPGIDLEEFLQSLWRNTLAHHESRGNIERTVRRFFVSRGIALTKSIYPDRTQRRALYNTGLPPRDAGVLVDQLSEFKDVLLEAVDYAKWDSARRISHFIRLVELTSRIETFKICNLNIGRNQIRWSDVFAWWMSPNSANCSPSPGSVSRWYNFVSKHFIYGLNWAIGAIIGAILERDDGEGPLLARWRQCGLPWSVLWYKDMVSWGTLDPIVSYVLAKKEAFTRPDAAAVAAEYWATVDEISDADLAPIRVAEWMSRRGEARYTTLEYPHLPQREIPVELVADFSKHEGSDLRVLPSMDDCRIGWYDPAGFLLAKSGIPDNWEGLNAVETDFFLNPLSSVVTWRPYV